MRYVVEFVCHNSGETMAESSSHDVANGEGFDGMAWRSVESDIESIQDYYDSAGSAISFGLMDRWRKKAALETGDDMRVIEVGSGPGSFSRYLRGKEVVLLEPNENMLRRSVRDRLVAERYVPVIGVAEHMPFIEDAFDRVMSGFSFKNLLDRNSSLLEMKRVLRKGGRAVIIDIALPDTRFRRSFMNFYMKHILYRIAFLTVPKKVKKEWGHNPWKHLSLSYMSLGEPRELSEEMAKLGYVNSRFRYLMTHGVAIICGDK